MGNKGLNAIGWLLNFIVGPLAIAVPLYLYVSKKDKFSKYHLGQMAMLYIIGIIFNFTIFVLGVIGFFTFIFLIGILFIGIAVLLEIVYLFIWFVFVILGAYYAWEGKKEIPILYDISKILIEKL
jgi:cellulose synthase/poly-beta-1,6-N-acetylglucosamine synthase-like glycosyltransferase